jgi:hypothetical protein
MFAVRYSTVSILGERLDERYYAVKASFRSDGNCERRQCSAGTGFPPRKILNGCGFTALIKNTSYDRTRWNTPVLDHYHPHIASSIVNGQLRDAQMRFWRLQSKPFNQ